MSAEKFIHRMKCVKSKFPESSDATTPDIVVDSRYSTVDSNDTGYMSDASSAAYDAYDIGPINELTHLVVLNKTKVSMFRYVLHYNTLSKLEWNVRKQTPTRKLKLACLA